MKPEKPLPEFYRYGKVHYGEHLFVKCTAATEDTAVRLLRFNGCAYINLGDRYTLEQIQEFMDSQMVPQWREIFLP
jgi:hypothetical protein